jgi:hypothetical protein
MRRKEGEHGLDQGKTIAGRARDDDGDDPRGGRLR